MSGYRSGANAGRLVTKPNTAGPTILGGSAVLAATGSSNGAYGAWTEVTSSLAAESYLTGVHASGPQAINIHGPITVVVGIGSAGLEVAIGTVTISGVDLQGVNSGAIPVAAGGFELFASSLRVTAGQRVAVRTQMAEVSGTSPAISVRVFSVPFANVEGN